jgi:HPt (histidine-containing phosphotransfer) domain-containing protein
MSILPTGRIATGCILDREVALSRVGGDLELLKEIAVLFLENYQAWLGELREAAARGDPKGVESTAHGLKGSVANFGAQTVVDAALRLETMGRGRDLTGVSQSLAALESALAALRPELESL